MVRRGTRTPNLWIAGPLLFYLLDCRSRAMDRQSFAIGYNRYNTNKVLILIQKANAGDESRLRRIYEQKRKSQKFQTVHLT